MTFIVPNFFIEQNPHLMIAKDGPFSVAYSSRKSHENIMVRNTTHVMILLIHGKKVLRSQSDTFYLKAGDIMILTQGNYFMSEILSEAGEYEAILLYFDDDFVLDFMREYEIKTSKQSAKDIVIFKQDTLLEHLTYSFKLYMKQNLVHQSDIIKLKTYEIFLHLLAHERGRFESFLEAVFASADERIRHILEANIDIIESVEDMCRIARVSKRELRTAMLSAVGILPKAWLDAKRLEEAALLLKSTDKTISDIATTCGYATTSWFGVQFKKRYGCSPKAYREG